MITEQSRHFIQVADSQTTDSLANPLETTRSEPVALNPSLDGAIRLSWHEARCGFLVDVTP
jgi:hypothetical protein